jgi:O-antigen/teichoic acid export membrane protein
MLLRQTILYLPAQLVGPLAQLVSAVVWTYFLSPGEIGLYALTLAAQELAYTATLSWFTLYTVRHFNPHAPAERTPFLETEAAVLMASGIANAGVVLALPLFVTGDWHGELIGAAIAYCILRSAAAHLADRARAAADPLTYSLLQVLWPIAGLLIGWLFVKFVSPTAAALVWAQVLAQLLTLALGAARLGLGRRLSARTALLKAAATYATPLVLGGVFTWFASNGIRFIIGNFEGAAAVGLVTVGWGLGLRGAAFAAMLVTAASFPLAVARLREGGIMHGKDKLIQNGALLFAVIAPAAAGLWAISRPLSEFLVAEPFREMTAAVLPWAILAGAARNLRIHFGQHIFLLHEETKIALATDIVDGVASMIGAIVGLLSGGLTGCLIGAALGACAGLGASLVWGFLRHNFSFPLADFVKIAGATLIMVAVVRALPIAPTLIRLSAVIAAGASVYCLVLGFLYPESALTLWRKARAKLEAISR